MLSQVARMPAGSFLAGFRMNAISSRNLELEAQWRSTEEFHHGLVLWIKVDARIRQLLEVRDQ